MTGFCLLRDVMTFEALREHHELLISFQGQNSFLMGIGAVVAYAMIAGPCLPGSAIAYIIGGIFSDSSLAPF